MHQLEKEREERKRVRREQREEERKRQRVLAEEEAAEALRTPQQTSFLKDLLEVGGGSGDSHSSQARSNTLCFTSIFLLYSKNTFRIVKNYQTGLVTSSIMFC